MFIPNNSLQMLIKASVFGKLLRILAFVLSVNEKYPAKAIRRQSSDEVLCKLMVHC
jgi:hypothetical protein